MDPTPPQIEAEYPAWRVYRGTNMLWYARRELGTPGAMLWDENLTELRAQVASWERLHAAADT